MMPDLFHWLLCGSQVVEFTNATTSQCLDATTGTWAWDLLRKFEIPTGMFGEVVLPGTKLENCAVTWPMLPVAAP